METFRDAWTSLLGWVPSPIRLVLAIVIGLAIITKLVPWFIHEFGALLSAGWARVVGLLTYPEFLITSAFRRHNRQPPPGTHGYDRMLGVLAVGGTTLGGFLKGRVKTSYRYPWKPLIPIVLVVIGCWYITPRIPASEPRTVLQNVNNDVVRLDSWIATGKFGMPTTTTGACTPKTNTKPSAAQNQSSHVRHHKNRR